MDPVEQTQASVIHKPGCEGFESAKYEAANICKSWCWGHMECEPLPKDNSHYMVCGECMHVFTTADELLDLYNAKGVEAFENLKTDRVVSDDAPFTPETDVDNIYFCPVCVHDF